MRSILSIFIIIQLVIRLGAAEVGLYDISDQTHIKPLPDRIGEVTVSSTANDNKHYSLQFKAASSFSLPCEKIGLIVGGKTIRFNSQGIGPNGYTSIETHFDTPEILPDLVEHFHAKVNKRRHPGHQMLVEFIPGKQRFSAGEKITATLRITNVGDSVFSFIQGGRQRGSRDNQFAFTAELNSKQMLPDIGNPLNYGGLGFPKTLKPGDSHELDVDLTKWFDFKEPGFYRLRGSYFMSFMDSGSQNLNMIWEDFACAEFSFEIRR